MQVVLVPAVGNGPGLVDQRAQRRQVLGARRAETARDHLQIGGEQAVPDSVTGDQRDQLRGGETLGEGSEAPLGRIQSRGAGMRLGQCGPGEPGTHASKRGRDRVRAQSSDTGITAVAFTRQDTAHDTDPYLPTLGAISDVGVDTAIAGLQAADGAGSQQTLATAEHPGRGGGSNGIGHDAHSHAPIQPCPDRPPSGGKPLDSPVTSRPTRTGETELHSLRAAIRSEHHICSEIVAAANPL